MFTAAGLHPSHQNTKQIFQAAVYEQTQFFQTHQTTRKKNELLNSLLLEDKTK